MLRSGTLISEETNAPPSRVVGVFYEESLGEPHFGFKIEHKISKRQIRNLVMSKKFRPIDRPVVADDLDSLIAKITSGNFDNNVTLDDIIYFIANTPGGGVQYLVRNNIMEHDAVTKVYMAIFTAVYNREYAKEMNKSRVKQYVHTGFENNEASFREAVPGDTEVVSVDMIAVQKAKWRARQAFLYMRRNQSKYSGKDYRATQHNTPETDHTRAELTTQLMSFLMSQMEKEAITAVTSFIPKDLHSLLMVGVIQDRDAASKQFRTISAFDNAMSRQQKEQDKVEKVKEKEAALWRQYSKALQQSKEIIDKASWKIKEIVTKSIDPNDFQNVGEDEDDIDELMEPYYIIYTNVFVQARPFFSSLVNHLAAEFNKKQNSTALEFVKLDNTGNNYRMTWNTGIQNLSLFVAEADQASQRVKKEDHSIVTQRELDRMKQKGMLDGAVGMFTKLLNKIVQRALPSLATQFHLSVISTAGPAVVIGMTKKEVL